MKDYLRRTAKFILYMAVIFFLVLVLYPLLIEGISPAVTLREMFQNQKFMLFLAFLVAYSLIYPLVGFVKIKRHLNGTFADNRGVFEKAFETLNYIKTVDDPDRIVYRRKSKYWQSKSWCWYTIMFTFAPPASNHQRPCTSFPNSVGKM